MNRQTWPLTFGGSGPRLIPINTGQCTGPSLTWSTSCTVSRFFSACSLCFRHTSSLSALRIDQVIPASGPLHLLMSLPEIYKALHLVPETQSGLPPCCCHMGTPSPCSEHGRPALQPPFPGTGCGIQQVPGTSRPQSLAALSAFTSTSQWDDP